VFTPLLSLEKYESRPLDTSIFLFDHSTALWAALSAGVSGIGAWLLSLRKINASVERARIKISAEASASEIAERAAFRATLMAELSVMRQLIRECEADKEALRERLNIAEGQIIILKASNEIMERWVTFFKDRHSSQMPTVLRDVKFDNAR
jgi:hypothetical protein